jgi:hypothetical protein
VGKKKKLSLLPSPPPPPPPPPLLACVLTLSRYRPGPKVFTSISVPRSKIKSLPWT